MSDSSKTLCTAQIVAIRREDHLWERRAPLMPDHVKKLCQQGNKIIVQPSSIRIFADDDYRDAGAEVQEDINEAAVILGIKEIPEDLLLKDKTYMFFSHFNKGVEEDMRLLRTILSRNIRMIDYEELNEKERLTTVFSVYAGMIGFVDILNGLGLRLLALGHNTPFLNVCMAHNYRGTSQVLEAVRECGNDIALGKLPKSIGPMIFVILGSGNCSKGVQKVLEQLPHENIEMKDLAEISEKGSMRKIYCLFVNTKDYLKKKGGGDFDREEYRNHPYLYESTLGKVIAPYATVIINCLNWNYRCPVLMTNFEVKSLLSNDSKDNTQSFEIPHKLIAICDITGESGGFECITTHTTLDHPFFIYDAEKDKYHEDFYGSGVLVCAIDNLPSQLALESSEKFANSLFPYMESITSSDATKPLDEQDFHSAVRGAVIASNGKLTSQFEYLKEFL